MKKISIIITTLIFNFILILNVKAGSLSINGNTSAYTGSSIALTINFNNIAGHFQITSSDSSVLSGGSDDYYDNTTATVYFKALKAGTATITVTPNGKVGDYDTEGAYTGGARSITINVIDRNSSGGNNSSNNSGSNKPIDINKTYSKNNYLKILDVDGYDITPKFDKDTSEYKLDLDNDVTKINVKATPVDENATVKGDGEVLVSEGVNTINIVVTAENGNERTYKIIATVEDKKPINVKIGKKKYTVVKRKELIEPKEGYKEKEIEINGTKIPALYNEVTKVTLVGLKDEKGKINLYSYDSKTGKYSLYTEFKFDIMDLYVHTAPKNKYEKTKIKINNIEVTAYKIKGVDDYYLLYATNMSTGYKGYYLYDSKENSVQRYNEEMLSKIMQEKDKYFIIVIVLSCVCFLCMAFMLIQLNKGKK